MSAVTLLFFLTGEYQPILRRIRDKAHRALYEHRSGLLKANAGLNPDGLLALKNEENPNDELAILHCVVDVRAQETARATTRQQCPRQKTLGLVLATETLLRRANRKTKFNMQRSVLPQCARRLQRCL